MNTYLQIRKTESYKLHTSSLTESYIKTSYLHFICLKQLHFYINSIKVKKNIQLFLINPVLWHINKVFKFDISYSKDLLERIINSIQFIQNEKEKKLHYLKSTLNTKFYTWTDRRILLFSR